MINWQPEIVRIALILFIWFLPRLSFAQEFNSIDSLLCGAKIYVADSLINQEYVIYSHGIKGLNRRHAKKVNKLIQHNKKLKISNFEISKMFENFCENEKYRLLCLFFYLRKDGNLYYRIEVERIIKK